jgi:hypothetical protein
MGGRIIIIRVIMQCSKCSYQLSPFDIVCPRCKGEGIKAQSIPPNPPVHQKVSAPLAVGGGKRTASIASLVLAILALLLFLLPFVPVFLAGLAIFLGIKGLKTHGGRRLSIGGISVGCVAFALSLWISVMVINIQRTQTANQRSQEEFRKRLASPDFQVLEHSASLTSSGNYYTITITGRVKNVATYSRTAILIGTVFNSSKEPVAKSTFIELMSAGETKNFKIEVKDPTKSNPFTYTVEHFKG